MNIRTLNRTAAAVAIALTTSIGSSTVLYAATDIAPSVAQSKPEPKDSLVSKHQLLEERQQKIAHEALEALSGTQNALLALHKKDAKKAMMLLKDVSGKLDILMAKPSGLNLIPAMVEANVYDFDSSANQVENLVDEAEDLLEAHQVQAARQILAELVSEIRISTTSIPIGTYPVAIKDATKLIDQGKTDEAAAVLSEVLSMLVTTTEVMPLPVLRAEALLTVASELEHKTDLSQADSRNEIQKFTNAAREKLKLAEMLGYGDKQGYEQLYESIDEINDVIFSEKSAAIWDKIKNSLSIFKNKIIHPK